MQRGLSAATLTVIVLAGAQAFGMLADVPLPKLVMESDLVVVGEVKKNAEAKEMALKLPGWPGAGKRWFVRSTFHVERFLHDPNKPAGGRGKKIEILAITPAPRKPGAGPRLMHSEMFFANLQPGQKYLLILHKLPGRNEYYVPTYPKNYTRINAQTKDKVAEIEKIADVNKWPWGKEVKDLQMALLPLSSRVPLSRTQKTRGGPVLNRASVMIMIAFRNTSDKPIAVNVYPWDRFLSLKYTIEEKLPKTYDLYESLPRSRSNFAEWHSVEIPPGKVTFAGPQGPHGVYIALPQGPGAYGVYVTLEASPGMLMLQGAYTANRKASSKSGLKLWTGTLQSADVEIEVFKP